IAATLIRNERATDPTAIPPINFSGKRNHRPKMPLIAAPASGSNGTSQMYLYIDCRAGLVPARFLYLRRAGTSPAPTTSPIHQIDLVDPDGFPVAIKRDHDAKSDGRLSRGDDNNKDSENLARHRIAGAGVLQVTRESNEIQVRGI